jgi:hypothetical protein
LLLNLLSSSRSAGLRYPFFFKDGKNSYATLRVESADKNINCNNCMARAELGKGGMGMDTINVYGVKNCPPECSLQLGGNGKFRCLHHNGDATVEIEGGVTRETLKEFKAAAPCIRG